jgi:hypothetical protein
MSEESAPERIAIVWSPEARADLRAVDREPAMQILRCIDDYVSKRVGGVRSVRAPGPCCLVTHPSISEDHES